MSRQGADDEYGLSIEELTDQVLQLDRALQATQGNLVATQTRLAAGEEEARKQANGDNSKSAIRDARGLKPAPLKDARENWRKWNKMFARWLRLESEDLYAALMQVSKAKDPIPIGTVPEKLAALNRWVYIHLHHPPTPAGARR